MRSLLIQDSRLDPIYPILETRHWISKAVIVSRICVAVIVVVREVAAVVFEVGWRRERTGMEMLLSPEVTTIGDV